MEIPKAPIKIIPDKMKPYANQIARFVRNADHDHYAKLIEEVRIEERKWIGEWLGNTSLYTLNSVHGIESLKSGKRPE